MEARFVQNVTTKDCLTLCWFPSPTSPSSSYDACKKGSGVSSLKLLHADWRHGGCRTLVAQKAMMPCWRGRCTVFRGSERSNPRRAGFIIIGSYSMYSMCLLWQSMVCSTSLTVSTILSVSTILTVDTTTLKLVGRLMYKVSKNSQRDVFSFLPSSDRRNGRICV